MSVEGITAMTEQDPIPQSLVEQIFEKTFAHLKGQESFDDQLLEMLRELAVCGDFSKPAQISRIVKSAPGR